MRSLPCFCCGKEIEHEGPPMSEGDSIIPQAWNGAATIEIAGGYGSQFDMGVYHGVVCDECIKKNADRIKQVYDKVSQTKTTYTDNLEPVWFSEHRYHDPKIQDSFRKTIDSSIKALEEEIEGDG